MSVIFPQPCSHSLGPLSSVGQRATMQVHAVAKEHMGGAARHSLSAHRIKLSHWGQELKRILHPWNQVPRSGTEEIFSDMYVCVVAEAFASVRCGSNCGIAPTQ